MIPDKFFVAIMVLVLVFVLAFFITACPSSKKKERSISECWVCYENKTVPECYYQCYEGH